MASHKAQHLTYWVNVERPVPVHLAVKLPLSWKCHGHVTKEGMPVHAFGIMIEGSCSTAFTLLFIA